MELQVKNIINIMNDYKENLPNEMYNSEGTGLPLVKGGDFAADMIRFMPGKCIYEHTHPGNHILLCVEGTGVLKFNNQYFHLEKGVIYFVPGMSPHAILTTENDSRLTLLSIADQHLPVNSSERSVLIDK